MRAIHAGLLAAAVMGSAIGGPLRAMLVDGPATQQESSAIKNILESNGLFEVDILKAPEKGDANLESPFGHYKVIVLNYGGDTWPKAYMTGLEKYVDDGGGLVVLPGADSAFPDWPEYGRMLGISGAPNRTESSGPIWFYKDNNIVYDGSLKGPGGKLAPQGEPVPITTRYTEHPITKGLPLVWMHAPDAIAGDLRGPGTNMMVLATANIGADQGGTARDEPQLVIITYGKGRVFHTELGRSPSALACAGFQVTLQRGAEWAATGKVTQKLPPDFPDENKPSIRGKAAAK